MVFQARGLVEDKQGRVTMNGRELNVGDGFVRGQTVHVGAKSWCRLLVRSRNSSIRIRLLANSSYTLSPVQEIGGNAIISGRLDSGGGLFEPTLDRTSFITETPTSVASVRGTSFSIVLGSDGSVQTTVYAGEVVYRRREPQLEDLPSELFARSSMLHLLREALKAGEISLLAGEQGRIGGGTAISPLSELPELRKALSEPALVALRGSSGSSDTDLGAAAEAINRQIPPGDHARTLEKLRGALIRSVPAKSRLEPDALLKHRAQFDLETPSSEATKTDSRSTPSTAGGPGTSTSAKSKIDQVEELYKRGGGRADLQKIEEIFGEKRRTLTLKSGKQLIGVVRRFTTHYLVFTASGKHSVPISDVPDIPF